MSSHHHHHHHQEERPYVAEQYCREGFEGERLYAAPPDSAYERVNSSFYEESTGGRHHHQSGNYQRNERLGELGAVAAGAFALYENNKAKTDPCNATKHKREAEAAALGALGSGGYAYYEHREKDKYEDGGRW